MPKTPKNSIPVTRFGGVRVLQRRIKRSAVIEQNKEKIAKEIINLSTSRITDVMEWKEGKVYVKNSADISDAAIRSIERIKVTPTKFGDSVEIKLWDKPQFIKLAAKASGILDEGADDVRTPSVIGIIMKGPEEKPKEKIIDLKKKEQ